MIVVYTAILGGSDSLKPAPAGADRCVCFTDRPDLYSDSRGWELKDWGLSSSGPRAQAWVIRAQAPHLWTDAVERLVWVDASFIVHDLPALLRAAGNAPLAGMRHHDRNSCYEEGEELVGIGQSTREDVDFQLNRYRAEGFAPTSLTVAGILVRRNLDAVRSFGLIWSRETSEHAGGDNTQLSLDYAAWRAGVTPFYLPGSYIDNPFFTYDIEDHHARRRPYR